ncbi:hypothetical protein C0J52_10217, partial [Blattella germanica]
GLGIKCYLCNSSLNSKCGDPINQTALEPIECSRELYQQVSDATSKAVANLGQALNVDIPQGQIGASTNFVCQKVDIRDDKGNQIIMRGCTLAKSESGGDTCEMSGGIEKLTGGHGKVHFCQTCEQDLCNSSNHLSSTALLLMLVPCLAIVMSHV